jgi:hypothetical protein
MTQKTILILGAMLATLVMTPGARAQAFDMSWFTIDCGGQTSDASSFELSGTIGQPDAVTMAGGGFELSGGFWALVDASGCGSADFNCDGDIGTDADIEAFFACLGGHCPALPCPASADFNADGDIGTDSDIEAFFRVLGGGSC